MDGKEDISCGVTVRGDEVPQSFFIAPRPVNPVSQQPGAPNLTATVQLVNLSGGLTSSEARKRRGRPRKYGAAAAALSPMPISASIPLTGDYSGWKQPRVRAVRPFQTIKKAHKLEFENIGDRLAHFVGANFKAHLITVNAGEDVVLKVLSFSQQESRAICILCATGSISNVTLRQPSSSGGTLTYEGHFDILSLCGSLMPTENGIVKSRVGGLSITLAGPDGRVFGGGLAGLLVAASPVQVVLGSFIPGRHQVHKPRKQKTEPVDPVTPAAVNPVQDGVYGMPKVNFASPPSFHADNLPPVNSTQDPRGLEVNNNASTPKGGTEDDFDDDDDDDDSLSHLEMPL